MKKAKLKKFAYLTDDKLYIVSLNKITYDKDTRTVFVHLRTLSGDDIVVAHSYNGVATSNEIVDAELITQVYRCIKSMTLYNDPMTECEIAKSIIGAAIFARDRENDRKERGV